MVERTDKDIQRDAAKLKNTVSWPAYPILPMVSVTEEIFSPDKETDILNQGLGLIFASQTTRVYLGNMFTLGEINKAMKDIDGKEAHTYKEILARMPHRDYPDIISLLKEWKVD